MLETIILTVMGVLFAIALPNILYTLRYVLLGAGLVVLLFASAFLAKAYLHEDYAGGVFSGVLMVILITTLVLIQSHNERKTREEK
jgi:membrane protease YdiL (CAAX protease family)